MVRRPQGPLHTFLKVAEQPPAGAVTFSVMMALRVRAAPMTMARQMSNGMAAGQTQTYPKPKMVEICKFFLFGLLQAHEVRAVHISVSRD